MDLAAKDEVRANLAGANLSEAYISGADFAFAKFRAKDLQDGKPKKAKNADKAIDLDKIIIMD